MTYQDVVDEYDDRLSEIDGQLIADLYDAYLRIQDELLESLARLEETLEGYRDEGKPVSQAVLARSDALNALIDQTQERISQLAVQLGVGLDTASTQAIDLAQESVRQLTLEGMGPPPPGAVEVTLGSLPNAAIERIVTNLQPGSPLMDLLAELGPDAAAAVRDALIVGLGAGQGVREVAAAMQDALGGSMTRAVRIARTEVLGAYREASIATMAENADVVRGWRWHANLDARTCAACIAMHGTEHPLDEPFGTHPQCRCTPLPITATWADLGFEGMDEVLDDLPTGLEWFNQQDAETQRQILGDAKYAAWKDGAFTLDDVVGYDDDETWGPKRWERSLKDILAA